MGTGIFELGPFDAKELNLRPATGKPLDGLPSGLARSPLGWSEGDLERFLAQRPHAEHLAKVLGFPWSETTVVLRQLADLDLALVNPGGRALVFELKAQGGDGIGDAVVQLARNFSRARQILQHAYPGTQVEPVLLGGWSSTPARQVSRLRAWTHLAQAAGVDPRVVLFRVGEDALGRRCLVLIDGLDAYPAVKEQKTTPRGQEGPRSAVSPGSRRAPEAARHHAG